MKIRTLFFAKTDIYNVIRNVGGQWNDSKERPNYFRQHITDVKDYLLNELTK